MTSNRQLVLNMVRDNKEHYNAEELFFKIKEQNCSMVFATVYNSLNYLCSQGIIRRLHIPNQADRFDGNLMPHDHFVCDTCGKVFDTPSKIESVIGFDECGNRIESCEVVYRGKCAKCL